MSIAARFDAIKNTKIGNWLVLPEPYSVVRKPSGKILTYLFQCRCVCGVNQSVNIYVLIRGVSIGCGCRQRENSIKQLVEYRNRVGPAAMKPHGEADFNRILRLYEYSAKKKGFPFEFDRDAFRAITSMDCYYCGVPPSGGDCVRYKRSCGRVSVINGSYAHNGIDRKDNRIGYTLDNSVPCCAPCNYFKRDRGHDEFLGLIRKIHEHSNAQGS